MASKTGEDFVALPPTLGRMITIAAQVGQRVKADIVDQFSDQAKGGSP